MWGPRDVFKTTTGRSTCRLGMGFFSKLLQGILAVMRLTSGRRRCLTRQPGTNTSRRDASSHRRASALALFLHAAHRSRVTCGRAFSRYRQQAKRYSHVYTRFSV